MVQLVSWLVSQSVSYQPSVLSGWLLSVVSGPLSLVSVQSLCGLCFASCHSPLATCLLTGPSTLLSPADGPGNRPPPSRSDLPGPAGSSSASRGSSVGRNDSAETCRDTR